MSERHDARTLVRSTLPGGMKPEMVHARSVAIALERIAAGEPIEPVEDDYGFPRGMLEAGRSTPDQAPPWVVFHRGDGVADILPAMRSGEVLAGLPLALAHVIVNAANGQAPVRSTRERALATELAALCNSFDNALPLLRVQPQRRTRIRRELKRLRALASAPETPAGPGPTPGTFCGKSCQHGSPCLLYADHVPADRHEGQHGCVFYDPRKTPAAPETPADPEVKP